MSPLKLLGQWGRRVLVFWPAKMIGTTLGMSLFFVVYFWVLKNPHSPPEIMKLTALDRWIVFWPGALPLYLSLWFYVSLAPALLINRRELLAYTTGAVALGAIGLGLFYVWPTAVPLPDVDWSRYPGFDFLKAVDASGNACPSLHVAFAVFTAAWFARIFREMKCGLAVRSLNWLWCVGILYSTIATRQHVALDVLAGTLLGGVVAWFNLRSERFSDSASAGVPVGELALGSQCEVSEKADR